MKVILRILLLAGLAFAYQAYRERQGTGASGKVGFKDPTGRKGDESTGKKPKTYRPVRSETRFYVKVDPSSQGELVIGNGNDQTALVKLISRLVNAKACVSVILPKSSVTISRVPDGHYELEFALGDEIMTGTETFWQPMAHRKFAKPLEFSTSQQYVDGRIITKTPHLTVTLHSVKDGNASMVSIPPSEFDRY